MVTFTEVVFRKDAGDAARLDSLPSLLGLDRVGASGVIDQDVFSSIYTPGKLALLVSWAEEAAASAWMPVQHASFAVRHRRVRVIRDYGMFDRREAPQYFPEVERS